jgi:TM2 domain-containing membrane protein YozV
MKTNTQNYKISKGSYMTRLLLLGFFGVHRMANGQVKTGIAQLFLTISILGILVNLVWLSIDFHNVSKDVWSWSDVFSGRKPNFS